eukprot:TRINITY_DN9561_c0_g6_i1.p1 TRINITY_DN9561_c0_g6~~TRINITY_DN9561_c0_g6_i1.p1  ORF type:complete len:261 (+),score=29.44 TRINITY_DN9561_c0_g6_i1:739-1521(+)
MWVISIYKLYNNQAIYLHKLMLGFFIFKLCADSVCLLRATICKPSTACLITEVIKSSMASVSQTLLAVLITLLCLGAGVMNSGFGQRQYYKVTLVSLACYLVFNGYYLIGLTNELIKTFCGVLIILFCGYMQMSVFSMSLHNIKSIYEELQQPENQITVDISMAYLTKIKLYIVLCFFTMIYYLGLILIHTYLFIVEATDKMEIGLEGVKAVSSCIMYFTTALTFYPCFFTPSFRLAQTAIEEVHQTITVGCKQKHFRGP